MFTLPDESIEAGKRKGTAYQHQTRNSYPFDKYADICYWGNGVGCDGGDCWCPCHGEFAPMFNTNEEVEEWHND